MTTDQILAVMEASPPPASLRDPPPWRVQFSDLRHRLSRPPRIESSPAPLPPIEPTWLLAFHEARREFAMSGLDLPVPARDIRALRRKLYTERTSLPYPQWLLELDDARERLRREPHIRIREVREPHTSTWREDLAALRRRLHEQPRVRVVRPRDTEEYTSGTFRSQRLWLQELKVARWRLAQPVTLPTPPPPRPVAVPAPWQVELQRLRRRLRPLVIPPAEPTIKPWLALTRRPARALTPQQLEERLREMRREEGLYDAVRRDAHVAPTGRWKQALYRVGLRAQRPEKGGWRWKDSGNSRLRTVPAKIGPGWLHLVVIVTRSTKDVDVTERQHWSGEVRRKVEQKTDRWDEAVQLRIHPEGWEAQAAARELKEIDRGDLVTGELQKPSWMAAEEWQYKLEESSEFCSLLEAENSTTGWGNPDLSKKFRR